MALKIWAKDTNPWLALGAGLYWASYAFRIMNPDPVYSTSVGDNSPIIEDLFMTLWVFVTFLICKRWGVRRPRVPISAVMIFAAALVLVIEAMHLSLPFWAALLVEALDLFTLGASMILWGLTFASLEKHLAARNVVVAVLIAAALILVGKALSPFVPMAWMMCLSSAGGSAVMLWGGIGLQTHRRKPRNHSIKSFVALGAQRLAYGFSLGFFPTATAALATGSSDIALLTFSLVVVAVSAVAVLRSDDPPCTLLPALILVACWILSLPFLKGGLTSMFPSLFCAIWLSWQTLSSVQLSELKEQYGFSELDITFIDKMAIAVTILTGTFTCRIIEVVTEMPTLSVGLVEILLPIAFCGLAIMASFSLARLLSVRQEDNFKGRVAQAAGEFEGRVFASIATEFGLSPREHEVFAMLAQGHTSAFIAETAGINPGTTKAHIAHIYQKLDVHSKDEMLELVEDRITSGQMDLEDES